MITRVDGKPTTTADAVTRGVQAAGAGTPVTLEVRRDGATKTVTVTPRTSPDDPSKALLGIQIQPVLRLPVRRQGAAR